MTGYVMRLRAVLALGALIAVVGVISPAGARPTIARDQQVRAQAFFDNGSLRSELYIQEEASEGRKGPIAWYVAVGIRLPSGELVESGGGYYPIAFTYDLRLQVVHGAAEVPTQYFYTDSSGYRQAITSHITFDVTWRATTPPRWLNGPTPQAGTGIAFDRQAQASGFMTSPNAGTLSDAVAAGNDDYPTVVTFMKQVGVNGLPFLPSGICSYDLPFPVCV